MTVETFNKLLDELDGNSLETLKQKNAKYASPNDCLHNFDSGAKIMGSTPAQCAWGYMTKHLVALRDKVEKNDFEDREDLLEKCQDIINYIRFIWLIGNDDRAKNHSGRYPWDYDESQAAIETLMKYATKSQCNKCAYYIEPRIGGDIKICMRASDGCKFTQRMGDSK